MAVIYCRSTDGLDADPGTTWATAKATLAAAITAAGNGGTVYVSKSHNELAGASMTLTGPNTLANTCFIYAVDDTGNPEPPTTLTNKDSAATATIGTTGGGFSLYISGCLYFYGLNIFLSSGASNAYLDVRGASAHNSLVFEKCDIRVPATGSGGGYIHTGGSSNSNTLRFNRFIDCDFTFGSIDACWWADAGGYISIEGGAIDSVGTSITVFRMQTGADRASTVRVSDFDMTNVTADDYIVSCSAYNQVDFVGRRLKFPTSYAGVVADLTVLPATSYPSVIIHSYGTADQYYSFYEASQFGTAEESTAVYRTGGATYNGTTPYSVKLTAQASATYAFPVRFKLSELKLDLTSSKTLTVHTAQNSGTVYQDDEFWIEVEYPNSTDLAKGTFDNTNRILPLVTPANLTSSGASWTASGSEDKRKVAVTISAITGATDAQVTVWACLGKPSGVLYVCPKVDVT